MIFPSFSSFNLHVTIVATYCFTSIIIAFFSYSVISHYQHEAVKDSVYVVLGSLALTVLCVWFFGASTILSAATAGILTGEVLGLLIHELSHIVKKYLNKK